MTNILIVLQTCTTIPKRSGILDRYDKNGILEYFGSYVFIFKQDLRELGPVAAALSWDPWDIVSQTEKMSLDPVNTGSCLGKLWDHAGAGSRTTIMPLYLEDIFYGITICF